jgi:hypothetical protein
MRAKFLAGIAFLLIPALSFAQAPKQKITRADDLPRFQYPINGKVEDLVKSEDAFRPFAAEVRKNVESVLRDYEIGDASVKRDLMNTLVALDILEKRDSSARERLSEIKGLEEKPVAKVLSGLVENAILDARQKFSDRNSQAYNQAFSAALKRSLDSLPFDLVQNEVRSLKAGAEIAAESLVLGNMQAQLDPVVAKTGGLSSDLAHRLPRMRLNLTERIPLKNSLVETLGTYLSAHAKDKRDIWAERNVVLDMGKNYQPINVAVWDSGIDLAIFKDKIARDASGQPAVLAYDLDARKTTGNLYPLSTEQSQRYVEAKKGLKGMSDLEANVDSPEAAELRQTVAKLKPEQVRSFIEDLTFYSNYSHGTHVAGILAEGNPYAHLATSRMTFEWKMIPDPCPSQTIFERMASVMQDSIHFFKENRVRIVNMSWGGSVKAIEDRMEKCAIGNSIEERKKTARAWFDLWKISLENGINSAPGILFVAAAGNSNADASFDEMIPSSLKLPNLLTVGAVDKAGDEASFTSYGPTVVVHANGYEVDSYIPGGDRIKFSGTSMASPNVANLAAKILVVNPKLSPTQVIDIIRRTSEKTADGRRNLIDPRKAIAAAKAP